VGRSDWNLAIDKIRSFIKPTMITLLLIYHNIFTYYYHTVTYGQQSDKYEFASSTTTRTTFAFDACFVWKLAPPADERSGFFIENLSPRLTRSSTYLTWHTRTWPTGNNSCIEYLIV
jgi:hypothetical protein